MNLIDKINRTYSTFIFPIIVLFRKKNPKIKAKIEEVIISHEALIKEYELIKQKKSKLSSNKRKEVEAQIIYLIAKGHIKINQ